MPYVNQPTRDVLDRHLELLALRVRELPRHAQAGALNYVTTRLLLSTLLLDNGFNGPPTYADYNTAIGVLECCKLELYRRKVAFYEDAKMAANGDVTA